MSWLFVLATPALCLHKETGIGYIVIALNPLENLETDFRMCLPRKRPSTWPGVWNGREFTHRLTMVLTGTLVYILLVLYVPVALLAWKPLFQRRTVFFPLLCQSQRGAFWVSSSFLFFHPYFQEGSQPMVSQFRYNLCNFVL